MMTVNNQIGIPVYDIACRIQKQASVLVIFLVKIMIQIKYIVRRLQDRIIDIGSLNFEPADQAFVLIIQCLILFQHRKLNLFLLRIMDCRPRRSGRKRRAAL